MRIRLHRSGARRTAVVAAAVLAATLTGILAAPLPSPRPLCAAEPKPKDVVARFLKAKDDAGRAAALLEAAAVPAAALDGKTLEALRDTVLDGLRKQGRKIASGRNEWFDAKKDGWAGLYIAGGKGAKGIVLALHGGGAGAGDCGQAESSFAGAISSLGMRGIYPEVLRKTEYGWTDPPETERWVLELLKAARRASPEIDPDRVYVTGHSMGGYGTWTYGAIHADLFAAGAAFAGAPSVYWKPGKKDVLADGVVDGILPNLRNLPLFVYQSTDDRNVPCAANQCAAAELGRLRAEAAAAGDARSFTYVYEEVTGRGHDFPAKGPGPGLEWMARHVRDPRPAVVTWQPVRDWKTTFYWVRWTQPWIGSTLTVRADRAENTIHVTLKPPVSGPPATPDAVRTSLRSLSFLLDDRVLDTTREVVVRHDGEVLRRVLPRPSLAVLLRTAAEREDPAYVFACEVGTAPEGPETR